MRKIAVFGLTCAVFLYGCGQGGPAFDGNTTDAGSALDRQAIETGIMPDPEKTELAGRYETRSDLGIDKFCAVKTGANSYEVGFMAVFGPESKCEAKGEASVDGESVKIRLDGPANCSFDARFDGIELRFPGIVEDGCARICSERASLSGTHYFMVDPGNDAARKTLGRDIERLCD